MTRIVAVTSGKGGVGKTHLSVNLALQCARRGLRTCLFDADPGLANVNLLLKLDPKQTLDDVIAGDCHLQDIVLTACDIDVIPGGSGVVGMADLPADVLHRLGAEFAALARYDLIIFDTPSGVTDNGTTFVAAAPEALLVITPEPTALTDAYALIKSLRHQRYAGHMQVVVNQALSEHQAQHTYEKFHEVVRVYQGIELPLLGVVALDSHVTEAACAQTPVSVLEPDCDAAAALAELAAQLLKSAPVPQSVDQLNAFWLRLTGTELPATAVHDAPQAVPQEPAVAAAPETSIAQATVLSQEFSGQLTERLDRLEAGLAAVVQALEAAPKPTATPPISPGQMCSTVLGPTVDRRNGRRASATAAEPARFVRNAQRATPIDALQLRRVVGRMLVKAMPSAEAAAEHPVRIAVDQFQLEAGNDYSLRPGRYTRITLHCHHIQSLDSFIEEIFANCAITGCKVRHLGSHVRYWVTSGRDGCILLDGDDRDRNCVRVYMASGGNNVLEGDSPETELMPSLRRIWDEADHAELAPALLEKFPHQRVHVEGPDGERLELFRLLRRDRDPLLCAFHHADSVVTAGTLREQSP